MHGLEEQGPLVGPALRVFRLDAEPVEAPAVHAPYVAVGFAERPVERPPELDVLLTAQPDPPAPWVSRPDGLARLEAAVAAAPLAAVVLVQLLRLGGQLDLRGALLAESLAYAALQSGPEHLRWLAGRAPHEPAPPAPDAVLVERRGDRLEVTLDRPHVRNALDVAMRDGLAEAFTLALADPTLRELHLRGAGPAFCAGGDLGEFGTKPDPVTGHLVRTTRSPAALLAACAERLHVEAHVHGACIGAGIELAALAGRVVAAPDARFSLPELAFGLLPGAGGTASIPRRIGRERTAFLALTGEVLDAPTALAWGLVDEVRPSHR